MKLQNIIDKEEKCLEHKNKDNVLGKVPYCKYLTDINISALWCPYIGNRIEGEYYVCLNSINNKSINIGIKYEK